MKLREATPADGPAIRAIVTDTLAEFGFALESNGVDSDLDDIAASYQKRGGVFRVLIDDDRAIVGCGGLYPLSAETVELRKMYFRPEARGRGFGRAMLADLVDEAKRRGFGEIVLETASNLASAIRLYEKAGFVETRDPGHAARCDRTFSLRLGSA
jgi:putative acetyltransferase